MPYDITPEILQATRALLSAKVRLMDAQTAFEKAAGVDLSSLDPVEDYAISAGSADDEAQADPEDFRTLAELLLSQEDFSR